MLGHRAAYVVICEAGAVTRTGTCKATSKTVVADDLEAAVKCADHIDLRTRRSRKSRRSNKLNYHFFHRPVIMILGLVRMQTLKN